MKDPCFPSLEVILKKDYLTPSTLKTVENHFKKGKGSWYTWTKNTHITPVRSLEEYKKFHIKQMIKQI